MESLSIDMRPLQASDIEDLEKLQLQLFPVSYSKSFYEELLDSTQTQTILSIDKSTNQIVGVLTARFHSDYQSFLHWLLGYSGFKSGYIMTLGVLNTYRRKGIASSMLHQIEMDLKEKQQCKKMTLHCKVDNDAAIAFYKAHGFRIGSRLSNYYFINKKKEDAFFLEKNIDEKFFEEQQKMWWPLEIVATSIKS